MITATVLTIAWAAFTFSHLDALVFRGEGEYDYSTMTRFFGTWAVLPAALVWGALFLVVGRLRAAWARRVAWSTIVVLPLVVLVSALPFTGLFD